MSEQQSPTSEHLWLLDEQESFQRHVLQMAEAATRNLVILTNHLDPSLFDNEIFCDHISRLARRDRHSQVRILVKNAKPIVEGGHKLLKLSRRLPSSIFIKKLLVEPSDNRCSYLCADKELLLFQHDEGEYQGFANYQAGPEAQKILEEFDYLWQRQSGDDPQLRQLSL